MAFITLQNGETKVVSFPEIYALTDLCKDVCHSSALVLPHRPHWHRQRREKNGYMCQTDLLLLLWWVCQAVPMGGGRQMPQRWEFHRGHILETS